MKTLIMMFAACALLAGCAGTPGGNAGAGASATSSSTGAAGSNRPKERESSY